MFTSLFCKELTRYLSSSELTRLQEYKWNRKFTWINLDKYSVIYLKGITEKRIKNIDETKYLPKFIQVNIIFILKFQNKNDTIPMRQFLGRCGYLN